MNSLYASLLNTLRDEEEGALPPPLPTEVPVKEPGGVVAPVAAEPVSAPVEAPLVPTETAPEPPATARTLGEHFGIDMEDATPAPRTQNSMILPAAISKAGSQLGAALAGVRPDTSAGDGLLKQGAADAAAQDKSNDALTNFKQQLMLRVDTGKKGLGGKRIDEDLANPNSTAWKAMYAAYAMTPKGKEYVDNWMEGIRKAGGVPDFNYIGMKPSNVLSSATSQGNVATSQAGQNARQQLGFGQQEKMEEKRFGHSLELVGLREEFKQLADARDANVPGFSPLPGATPTKEDATKVKVLNARVAKVNAGLKELTDYVKAHPEDVNRWNPLADDKSQLSVLYGKVRDAYRVAEEFGVPSGKDMEMISDVVQDPRRFLNIFTGRDVAGYKTLEQAIQSEQRAQTAAYGYAAGAGAKTPEQIVRERVRKVVPAQSTGPASAQPVTAAKFRLNGQTISIPPEKLEEFQRDYPEAEAL